MMDGWKDTLLCVHLSQSDFHQEPCPGQYFTVTPTHDTHSVTDVDGSLANHGTRVCKRHFSCSTAAPGSEVSASKVIWGYSSYCRYLEIGLSYFLIKLPESKWVGTRTPFVNSDGSTYHDGGLSTWCTLYSITLKGHNAPNVLSCPI